MKGRSNRLQSSEEHDDWVDGSWTVDCICGVNFDDGEEMVDCDECGVWVHTRCSRYVKGDKDFICDKCKNKNRNDSEETEVAQLLVELPTKTMKMQSSFAASVPPQRPLRRLWTDIPMEERVHVHGIPGGDPALFTGLSKVFSPQLWKCTGHVPKKLNFRYKEFSCWDEPVAGSNLEDENENQDDKGAGVLFSLSKDSILSNSTPLEALVALRGSDEKGRSSEKAISKETNKTPREDDVKSSYKDDVGGLCTGMKEKSLVQPALLQSSKKGKEDTIIAKDCSGKKAGALEKQVDVRKKVEKAPSTAASDTKKGDYHEDRDPKSSGMGSGRIKTGKLKGSEPCGAMIYPAEDLYIDKFKSNSATGKLCLGSISSEVSRAITGDGLDKKKADDRDPSTIESSLKSAASIDGNRKMVDNLDDTREDFTHSSEKCPLEDLARTVSEAEDSRMMQHSCSDTLPSPSKPLVRVKSELDDKSGVTDATQTRISFGIMPEVLKVNNVDASSCQCTDYKGHDVDRGSATVDGCRTTKGHESSSEPHQPKQNLEISEGSVAVHNSSSELQNGLGLAKDLSKSGRTVLNSSPPPTQQETLPSIGKLSSSSSADILANSTVSDIFRATDTQNSCPVTSDRVTSECIISIKKDRTGSDIVRNEMQDVSRKTSQELKKSSGNSVVNSSSTGRISHTYVSKRITSSSRDSVNLSSSKASPSHNAAATSGSSDSAGSLQNQVEANVENKSSISGAIQRGEKNNWSNMQSSSKQNYSTLVHPPVSSSPAALSDEELALLLHQELNSSTRVPRVPRVRNAGSLPQLCSATSTSTILKRSSSSGGKDNSSASRRKNKDVTKDTFRSSREPEDEVKKTKRLIPPSPDQKMQDMAYAKDAPTKREDDASLMVSHAIKKKLPSVSTSGNSGPSSSTEAADRTLSSVRNSPRKDPDDHSGTVIGPVYRTLPGLISEIMSKGKRMTYEELCNAVLPHWQNLRKHNGERYAYSSHSQAVLDCLRNRHEWAQLVDRGPKTNSSRKRRMIDAEESDDNEYVKGRSTKEVENKNLESHREEFPKGKRKARKRRRLVLKGRGIRDVRKRRKAVMSSDDDDDGDGGPFSDSSEESMFSVHDSQGGESHLAEASASSVEVENL